MRPIAAHRSALLTAALLTAAGCSAGSTARVCPGPVVLRSASDVAAMRGCETVDGDLTVEGAPLASLRGMESVKKIRGTLTITGNPSLVSLDGLESLVSVRNLVVSGNPRLESLAALRELSHAQGVTLADLPALRSTTGLETLRAVDGLFVTNTSLEDLRGLTGLRSIGDLVIVGNPCMTTLAGLDRLVEIDRIDVEHNARLASTATLAEAARSVRWSFVDVASPVARR